MDAAHFACVESKRVASLKAALASERDRHDSCGRALLVARREIERLRSELAEVRADLAATEAELAESTDVESIDDEIAALDEHLGRRPLAESELDDNGESPW